MSEAIAIVRLAWFRHRLALLLIPALVLAGIVCASALQFITPPSSRFPLVAIYVTFLPAVAWSLMLFGFGQSTDSLENNESGYNHWLLRLPISDVKLALVPAAMKTIWTSGLWVVCAVSFRVLDGIQLSLLFPAIAFSAAGIWLTALAWRPFYYAWLRLVAMLICVIAIYLFVLIFFGHDPHNSLLQLTRRVVLFALCGLYPLGLWFSVRAVRLARINTRGLIREGSRAKAAEAKVDDKVNQHRSARAALLWHDLRMIRESFRWVFFLGLVPGTILLVIFIPFSIPGYMFAMIMCGALGFGSTSAIQFHEGKGSIVLPPYLAACPLSTAELVWVRMGTMIGMLCLSLSLSLLTFVGWSLWPGNRAIWNDWATEMAAQSGAPLAGVRIAAATLVMTCVLIVSRGVAYVWPSLTGRPAVQILVAGVGPVAYFVPFCLLIAWFVRQESWETTRASAMHALTYAPGIAIGFLMAKCLAVIIAIGLLRSRLLVSSRAIMQVIAAWLALAVLTSLTLHWLIPFSQATWLWCFAAVSITIPLARVLILPVSLHFGRHK